MLVALLVALIPICLGLGLTLFFVHLMRRQNAAALGAQERSATLKDRMARAAPARAAVVGSSTVPSSAPERGVAIVELRLEVTPPAGASYVATTRWEIDLVALPRVQPGEHVAIKIDADDPAAIYPGEGWAKPWMY